MIGHRSIFLRLNRLRDLRCILSQRRAVFGSGRSNPRTDLQRLHRNALASIPPGSGVQNPEALWRRMNPTTRGHCYWRLSRSLHILFQRLQKLVEAIIRIIDAHLHTGLEHTITISNRLEDGL